MNTRVNIENFLSTSEILTPIAVLSDDYPDYKLDELAAELKLEQVLRKTTTIAYEPSDELMQVLDDWERDNKIKKINFTYFRYSGKLICLFVYKVMKKDLLINRKIFLEKNSVFDTRLFYNV